LEQKRKKSENDYGYDESELGLVDDSEKIEWDEYYKSRGTKWRTQNQQDD
jgi:hypothetical protein